MTHDSAARFPTSNTGPVVTPPEPTPDEAKFNDDRAALLRYIILLDDIVAEWKCDTATWNKLGCLCGIRDMVKEATFQPKEWEER